MVFLGREISEQRNYSDAVALQIDEEVHKIIDEEYERAFTVVTEHYDKLEAIALLLIREETIDDEQLERLFDIPRPKPNLVGPPTGRPSTQAQLAAGRPATRRIPDRADRRDPDPPAMGTLRPQPAGD
jgi:cell division protease FtsH